MLTESPQNCVSSSGVKVDLRKLLRETSQLGRALTGEEVLRDVRECEYNNTITLIMHCIALFRTGSQVCEGLNSSSASALFAPFYPVFVNHY